MQLRSLPAATRIWWGLLLMTGLQTVRFALQWIEGIQGPLGPVVGYQGCFLVAMALMLWAGRGHARSPRTPSSAPPSAGGPLGSSRAGP